MFNLEQAFEPPRMIRQGAAMAKADLVTAGRSPLSAAAWITDSRRRVGRDHRVFGADDPELIDENENVDTNYLVEAFVRGAHLVLIFVPKHSDPKFVRVFPMAGFRFNGVMWGFSTHMDFNSGRGTWRTILSERAIAGITTSEFIVESDKIADLDQEWVSQVGDWHDDMSSRPTT